MVNKAIRRRSSRSSKEKISCRKIIQKQIKKVKATKKGLTSETINQLTKYAPNFIGCFSEDVLLTLVFHQKPCFLIVNLDKTGMPGSHWIALGLFDDKIEVFDFLGFKIFNWPRIPCNLLSFLHQHSTRRNLVISPLLQRNNKLCGVYCIYYVLNRPFMSFSEICNKIDF